jgi:hypothetical protein
MEEKDRPHAFGLVEAHLRGPDLNAARRRFSSLGWKFHCTPAVPKTAKRFGTNREAADEFDSESGAKKFHNSGGEILLRQAHVQITGHHQDTDANGDRSVLIRFKGWTLHLILVYLDCDHTLDDGSNADRTRAIADLIYNIKLPWLVVGDFNRDPAEVATSAWCRYLRGMVTCPNVPFTCTHSGEGGGNLIDYTMHSRDLAPYLSVQPIYHYPFKPHVVALRVIVTKEVEADRHRVLDCPLEIVESAGPRNFDDSWAKHWRMAETVEVRLGG